MTNLDADHFKTGRNVSLREIHTATFDVSGSVHSSAHPYVHITPEKTTRIGSVSANWENDSESHTAVVSSRSHASGASYVDFDISFNDVSFNLLIRPQGNAASAVTKPTKELVASYARKGVGTDTTHMMTSVGCLNTYTRTSFNQMFRAEQSGIVSNIGFNEDFADPSHNSVTSISIWEMDDSGSSPQYNTTDVSGVLYGDDNDDDDIGTGTFGVSVASDISCITFDVSGANFNVSQNSLYMLTFDGSFCEMGLWKTGTNMSMWDVSGSGDTSVYETTEKKPYPMEVTVKSTSVSGKTDSGSTLSFATDISGITISTTPNASPSINSIYRGSDIYDVIVGITDVSGTHPHPPQSELTLMRIDCCGNDVEVTDVRRGKYDDGAVATKDHLFTRVGVGDHTTLLLTSYFDTSANEFKLVRCSVTDLLHHTPVFNEGDENSHYEDAVGPNTTPRFAERLEAIGKDTNTKHHTIPYDGEPNSGMRMACDVAEDASGNQWVAYTDLRYATNTDAFAYMVDMSATVPDGTRIRIPLRNPLNKAVLSYQYQIATFPTISMCGGDGATNLRYLSVGRHVYTYDTRAGSVTFVRSDISVYSVDTSTKTSTYVGTVESADATETEMPGFSQYVDLSGSSPHLHYTVTDVSGAAWGAKELKQEIGGGGVTLMPVPLNNHHMFQDKVMYDLSNVVLNMSHIDLNGSVRPTSSTTFHADVSGNLNVSGDCYANKFMARHTDANSVSVTHSLWANRVEAASISAASISIGGVELTAEKLRALLGE
jgi:hypothetical protein